MKNEKEATVTVDGFNMPVVDIDTVEQYINRDGRSIQLPEPVYFILASVVSAARGRR